MMLESLKCFLLRLFCEILYLGLLLEVEHFIIVSLILFLGQRISSHPPVSQISNECQPSLGIRELRERRYVLSCVLIREFRVNMSLTRRVRECDDCLFLIPRLNVC